MYVWLTQVDESLRAEEVEIYCDPAKLLAGLLKGDTVADDHGDIDVIAAEPQACPFFKGDQLKDGREDESKWTLDLLILLPVSSLQLQLQLSFCVFMCSKEIFTCDTWLKL